MQRNHLAEETSPYLLQHADNPVDWYPWGEAALSLARRENRPILLSIGYSACHWCHVMAHESFENAHTAALMNRLFVNIKVDREERPDLDKIYQVAQQLITQRPGGWPLTLFLTPEDQQPFFGGTYFPPERRRGMPAFTEILERVADYHRTHAAEIRQQNGQLTQAFASIEPLVALREDGSSTLDAVPLLAGRRALEVTLDPRYGGFGAAPKFPQAASLQFCLRHWHATSGDTVPDLKALYMASLTLTRMAEGGIYDQLGGGFARYSVDEYWMIPHFEKMLYDNGQLLTTYAEAHLATGEPLFARIAGETADWILRDMRSREGGFYSSLDADSEGHEGEFYVWSRAEIEAALPRHEYLPFARRFGLDKPANFEGRWHLHAHTPIESIETDVGPSATVAIDSARATLLTRREARVWPGRDEKVLTSWNALAIKGLAVAGRALRRADLTDAASAAVDFLRRHLWRDGRLLATFKDGRAHLNAYLDDYAFLADALLELLQNRWRTSDLEFARALLDVLLARFIDADAGGFYFTAADHERLIHRSRTFNDDSLPSGNAIAASALHKLGYLIGEPRYIEAAERTLRAAAPALQEAPTAHMSGLNALRETLDITQILIIRGDALEAARWARELGTLYAPSRLILAIPSTIDDLPSGLSDKRPLGSTTAYLCSGMTCSAPMHSLADVSRQLVSRLKA